MSEETLTEGWGWPGNSKKAHYFTPDRRALCGRWAFSGELSRDGYLHGDQCVACRNRRPKHIAPPKPKVGGA